MTQVLFPEDALVVDYICVEIRGTMSTASVSRVDMIIWIYEKSRRGDRTSFFCFMLNVPKVEAHYIMQ